jgi:UDP-glucose 4-epimerase
MSILVVGGAGYIGSHIVSAMHHKYEIVVVDSMKKGHAESVSGETLFIEDIRDKAAMIQILRQKSVEAVIHFAADSLVGESMQAPANYYDNNVPVRYRCLMPWCSAV